MPAADPRRLARLGITEHATDLRTWTPTAIVEAYGSRRSGRLVLTRLVRDLLWQVHQRIASGREPPVRGNIRTLWYRWLKPILARQPSWRSRLDKAWQQFIDTFSQLVLDERLFDYADFGLADGNWESRRIGRRRPQVLVFAEKQGWMRFLRQVHADLGVSVLALGGAPSALTSEYTARHLRRAMAQGATGADPAIHLVAIMDHDPSGAAIARAFQAQLETFGLVCASVVQVISPTHFEAEELATLAIPLRDGREVQAWLADGGGVGGDRLGLAAEAMPWERARRVVKEAVLAVAPEARQVQRPPWQVDEAHFILYVADQALARDFYSHVLEVAPTLDVPGMTEFSLSDRAVLGLMPGAGIKRLLGDALPDPAEARGVPRAEVYLVVDDPAACHGRALAAGGRELSGLRIMDWGHEVAYSLDLDGHVLAFAAPHAVTASAAT